jgi:hypothetical protein
MPLDGVDEELVGVAQLEVGFDQLRDHVGHLGRRERGPDHLAQRGVVALPAADRDLVPLGSVLVDAEDADVAHVVVAAGIHAAGDVEVELADVVQVVEVVEALLDGERDRDRLGVRERAEVAARARDDVGEQAHGRRGEPRGLRRFPHREQVALGHVGQDQVLLVRDAQLAEAVAVGEVGHDVHLLAGDVAGGDTGLLERQRDRGIAGLAVGVHVALGPAREGAVGGKGLLVRRVHVGQLFVRGRGEVLRHAVEFLVRDDARGILQQRPLLLDAARELFHAQRLHEDLDARLPDVVAAAIAVVDAQDRLGVREHVAPRHELADDGRQDRRAPHAAARVEAQAQLALGVAHELDADVVDLEDGAVVGGAVERDLELARQVGEFGVERRPLAQDLGVGARIHELVGGDAREVVGGDVADVVAARLDRVHLDARELREDVGHGLELRPVELQVLARREVAVAAVVAAHDARELAQLARGEQPVRHRDPVHRRVALDVEPVLQAQRAEFVVGQLAGEVAAGLVAELGNPFLDDGVVVGVVSVHEAHGMSPPYSRKILCCTMLITEYYLTADGHG